VATNKKIYKSLSPEEFVRVWQKASSVQEVATHFGCSRGAVAQRATNYRKQGVKLKKMGRNGKLVVDALNAIIANLD